MASKTESMAEHSEMVFLGLENIIVSTFEKLFELVTRRKEELLAELDKIKKEHYINVTSTLRRITELEGIKKGYEALETMDQSLFESGVASLSDRITTLEQQFRPPDYCFECDIIPISKEVPKLGRIVNKDNPNELIYEDYAEVDDVFKTPQPKPQEKETKPPLPPRRGLSSMSLSDVDLPFTSTNKEDAASVKSLEVEKHDKLVKHTSCLCFGERGEGKGKINNPRSISYNKSKEHIFIASYDRPKIYVYSRQGFFITKFGKKTLKGPVGICVKNRDCYVTDEKLNAIFKFSTEDFKNYNCTLQKTFKRGSGIKEFESLQELAIDDESTNNLYVIDSDNNRITTLNANLDPQSIFGQKHLNQPKDICISSLVYVLDISKPHCVHGFLKDGEKIHYLIKYEDVSKPIYFCITPNEKLIISGGKEEHLKAFSLYGSSQSIIETADTTKPGALCVLEENTIVCAYGEGKYAFYIIQH